MRICDLHIIYSVEYSVTASKLGVEDEQAG